VRVRTKSGVELDAWTAGFRGSPSIPATWDDVLAKAAGLVGGDLAGEMAASCREVGGPEPIGDVLAFRSRAGVVA
jgi:hypothetical protein